MKFEKLLSELRAVRDHAQTFGTGEEYEHLDTLLQTYEVNYYGRISLNVLKEIGASIEPDIKSLGMSVKITYDNHMHNLYILSGTAHLTNGGHLASKFTFAEDNDESYDVWLKRVLMDLTLKGTDFDKMQFLHRMSVNAIYGVLGGNVSGPTPQEVFDLMQPDNLTIRQMSEMISSMKTDEKALKEMMSGL